MAQVVVEVARLPSSEPLAEPDELELDNFSNHENRPSDHRRRVPRRIAPG